MLNKNRRKVIVWDVDGTLYQSDPKVKQAFKETRQELLEKYWHRSYQKELKELFQTFKKRHKSTTQTLAVMTGLSIDEVNDYVEAKLRNQRSLSPDPKLLEMFKQLRSFYHLALRNGGQEETLNILRLLGLDQLKVNKSYDLGPFLKVWGTVDSFHQTKPHLDVFDRVKLWIYKHLFYQEGQKITPQAVESMVDQILMVGDKPEVDLKPAKEAGFQTAWAWTNSSPLETPEYVDITLPQVYDLGRILTS